MVGKVQGRRQKSPKSAKSTIPRCEILARDERLKTLRRQVAAFRAEPKDISTITVNPRNARTHSDRQITQIAASIRQFGFMTPILVDEDGQVIAGHARLAAARSLGFDKVPVVVASHLSATEKRAYVIADNRLAELAGWDPEILKDEFAELALADLDFDIEITGFDSVDIDRLVIGEASSEDPADELVAPLPEAISRLDDIWCLGRHRVFCGSALDVGAYDQLLLGESVQLVFTDPPYNVRIADVSGLGRTKHREFAMASGEMSPEDFTAFLGKAIAQMVVHSADGAIHYICMDWRHLTELQAAARPHYSDLKNVCVWVKDNAGMGSFYRSQHELIHVYKVGSAPHINNFRLGERGRYRTNVWTYAGVNSFRRDREDELAMHPTVKPVAMVMDAIRDCSQRNGIVLDPFGGSGTTLIAAERTGRIARLIELDPIYVDVIVRRWQMLTGEQATLDGSGDRFDTICDRRRSKTNGIRAETDVLRSKPENLTTAARVPSQPAKRRRVS